MPPCSSPQRSADRRIPLDCVTLQSPSEPLRATKCNATSAGTGPDGVRAVVSVVCGSPAAWALLDSNGPVCADDWGAGHAVAMTHPRVAFMEVRLASMRQRSVVPCIRQVHLLL